jgi:hypothetical protein
MLPLMCWYTTFCSLGKVVKEHGYGHGWCLTCGSDIQATIELLPPWTISTICSTKSSFFSFLSIPSSSISSSVTAGARQMHDFLYWKSACMHIKISETHLHALSASVDP